MCITIVGKARESENMTFCINCGQELAEDAKFCANCGKATDEEESTSQRKTVYEGQIHKCPNCGDVINSFVSNCPSCGYEIRGAKSSSSVKEFVTKLETIEAGRLQQKNNPIKNLYFGQEKTKTDEQKISLIRSFIIPNTKEDLYEFLILSKSNIEVDLYENDIPMRKGDARLAISDAWKAKFEQAYQKAKLVFANDSRLPEIQAMYDDLNSTIKKVKWKTWKLVGIIYGVLCVVIAVIFIVVFIFTSNAEKKEIQRLEELTSMVEVALESDDYKLALMHADSLYYDGTDSNLQRDWSIKRDYWIDKVIEEAAKDGVVLERPKNREENSNETISFETPTESVTENSFLGAVKDEVLDYVDEFTDIAVETESVNNGVIVQSFVEGYEKAEYSKFDSAEEGIKYKGANIYIEGKLSNTEKLLADGTESILGYVTDANGNEWLIQMHVVPVVSENYFDNLVDKQVVIKGVYKGYSGKKKLPFVVLDEIMSVEDGTVMNGMQKLLVE